MKKRIFVILLALVLTAGLSIAVLAVGDESGAVAKIGSTEYATLGDAVADVPTDGTETTITLLRNASGGGVKVEASKNIIFDFAGHTYTVGAPTVGSAGTETSGFQLLKGSKVTMKNGTLIASDYADLKIMIQNYSDLTLLDMELDASGAPQCQYVASNNFGDVLITGNTSIYAAEGQMAFDVYYWPNGGYGDGVSVTVDTTGTIEGTIEYGSDGSTTGTSDVAEKAPLVIKNGTINSDIKTQNLGSAGDTGISITGGLFSSDVSAYVAEGNKLVDNGNGSYSVSVDTDTAVAAVGGVGYTTIQDAIDAASADLPVELLTNITLTSTLTIDKAVTIDGGQYSFERGSGFNSNLISVTSNGDLTLTNVTVDGKDINVTSNLVSVNAGKLTIGEGAVITGGTYRGVFIYGGGEVVLDGGSVTGNNYDGYNLIGPGIEVQNGTFTMNSGSITDNYSNSDFGGAAIAISSENGKAYLKGGEISGNTGFRSAAMCIVDGYVELDGTNIVNNVQEDLGTIEILWNGTLIMKSGSISNNMSIPDPEFISSFGNGGAIYLEGGYGGTATFTMTGGTISGNMAGGNGGAIYGNFNPDSDTSSAKTNINISGGTITGNYENAWWDGDQLSDKGFLSSIAVHPNVQLTLEGTPTIEGAITLHANDYIDGADVPNDNFLPIVVKDGFAPTSPIEVGVGSSPIEGQVLITFDGWTPADTASLFMFDQNNVYSGWGLKTDENGNLISAAQRKVVFKEGYYNTFSGLTINVFIGEKIPEPTGTIKPGYKVEGWYTDAALTQEWNFEEDVIPEGSGNFILYGKFTAEGTAINYPCSTKGDITLASGITAPEGYTYKFRWEDADGDLIGTDADITVKAPEAGSSTAYVLTVNVTDSEGNEESYTIVYTVRVEEHTGGKATCCDQARCSVCRERYGDLDPENHAYAAEIRNAVAATIDSEGYTGDRYCKGCGMLIKRGTVIPKLDHEHDLVRTEAKAATCTEDGNVEYYTCSTCGKIYLDATGAAEVTLDETVIPATGHDYGTEYEHDENEHWHECTACGERTDVSAHTFGEWTVTEEATATEAGSRERTCSVCGRVETEAIPATGEETTAETTTPPASDDDNSSNTGTIILWVVIAVVVVAAVVIIIVYMKKKKDNNTPNGGAPNGGSKPNAGNSGAQSTGTGASNNSAGKPNA